MPFLSNRVRRDRPHPALGFLKFENFKKIVDENPWVAEIELSNWGEILLNPDLVKIMAYAWKRSVNLRAENGVNLNTAPDEVLEGLVRYRFHSMNCSIDGASYPIYRRKGDFEKVILHVRKINAFKRKYGSEFPRLKWQFVAFGHNEHEIAKARQMAKELGMSFYVKLSWDGLYGESFSPVKDKETVRREVGLEAATREEYQERYHKVYIGRSAPSFGSTRRSILTAACSAAVSTTGPISAMRLPKALPRA